MAGSNELPIYCHERRVRSSQYRETGTPPMTDDLERRLRQDLEEIQRGDRPLPWVVHSGCSYRRIASEPTRENFRSFPDGNVLHAYKQSDGHPDLSMGEQQLEALVRIVNAAPALADAIARLRAENETNLAAMLWAAEEFDEERGETPDGWFGHCRKNIVAGCSEEHCGDCTNVPQSCMKCWADHYLERARTALQEGSRHE
jgi:hypothetical protein